MPRVFDRIDLEWDRDSAQIEPALTLASVGLFVRVAPPLALKLGRGMLAVGAADDAIRATAAAPGLSLRVTSFCTYLDAGEVSSSRDDWHIDRIGAIRGSGSDEEWDATDYTHNCSFSCCSAFLPERPQANTAAGTEFVVDRRPLIDDGWHSNDSVQALISAAMDGVSSFYRSEDRQPVSFSARHIHRPGIAPGAGWRLFIRIGAYMPSCSPYIDHLPFAIPITSSEMAGFIVRPLGTTVSQDPPRAWSTPVGDGVDVDRYLASRGLASDPELAEEFIKALAARRRDLGVAAS